MRLAAAFLLCALLIPAQEPEQAAPNPVLKNDGKPMRLPLQCAEEDIRAFGLTCPAQQPCPVYLELSGVEGVGPKLFAAGNLHTASATLWSVLLASDDGGATWYEPHERIRAAGLDQVQFFDFENGWISGHTLAALPRDPFLLITRDGGKTWRPRPVFPDGGVGVIDSFHFDSKTHGLLWIDRTPAAESDRYEIYESSAGGESWSLRQTGRKPLREKTAAKPAAPVWRLRADAATKSYRVEKNAGRRWERAAAFLVHAGECREPEPTVPPPVEQPAQPESQPAKPEPAKPKP